MSLGRYTRLCSFGEAGRQILEAADILYSEGICILLADCHMPDQVVVAAALVVHRGTLIAGVDKIEPVLLTCFSYDWFAVKAEGVHYGSPVPHFVVHSFVLLASQVFVY